MDVQMPVMDGIEATRLLRKLPQFGDLPIVALTAGAFKSQQEAAHAAGMSHFVSKPFDVPATIALIQRIRRVPAGAPADSAGMAMAASAGLLSSPGVSESAGEKEGPSESAPAKALPVLDVAVGLQLWSDERLYQAYLHQFVQSFADAVDQINRKLAEHDQAGAAAVAHKLAGVAGNLALQATRPLAIKTEQVLSMGYDPTVILASCTRKSATRLPPSTLMRRRPIRHGQRPGGEQENALLPEQRTALRETLAALLHALDSDDPAPAEKILDRLRPLVPEPQLAPLWKCRAQFRFPGRQGRDLESGDCLRTQPE